MIRCLALCLLLVPLPALADFEPVEGPDASYKLLRLDLRALSAEEISGVGASQFAVHTGVEQSAISFRISGITYVMVVTGADHTTGALQLFDQIQSAGGVYSFVAKKKGNKTQFFEEQREVLAIQLRRRGL